MDKNKPKFNGWVVMLFVLLIVSIGTITAGSFYIQFMKDSANALSEKYKKGLEEKNQEIENLKQEIETIKDADDVLRRDIRLYVKTVHPKVPNVVAEAIAKNVVEKSRKHKISPEIVLGIIKVESTFNPMAVGPKTKYGHARGLMQVMPEWAPKFNLKDKYELHNIDTNIECGIKVFQIHLEEGEGDISTGLYYYVNKDKAYVGKVYEAIGRFIAFRSTINTEELNVETDIDRNGESKQLPEGESNEPKSNTAGATKSTG